MGAAGFAIEAGLSDATEEEAQIKRLMVQGASEVVGLVDHTKWGRAAFATFCETTDIGVVVTDAGAPAGDGRGGCRDRRRGPPRRADDRPRRGRRPDPHRRRPVVMPAATAPAPPRRRAAPPAVALRDISKRFGATQALADVTLELRARRGPRARRRERRRQEHARQDPRRHPHPDTGTVGLAGEPIVLARPGPRPRAGDRGRPPGAAAVPGPVGRRERLHGPRAGRRRFGTVDWRAMRRQAAEIFRGLDVRIDPSASVRGLSMADQQLIEIAKALSLDARVLILDEPTASLSAHEVERLFTIVRQTRDRGVAVLFVSHRLDEVFELCDVATVFRDGKPRRHGADGVADDGRPHPPHGRPGGHAVPEGRNAGRRRPARGRGPGPRRGVPGRLVLGPGGRDRRHGRARRRRPDRGRAGPVRDRPGATPARSGSAASRWRSSPSDAHERRHRLRPGGPPPGRPRPRLLDRRERDAADPAPPVPAAVRPRPRRTRRGRPLRASSSASG